MIHPGSPALEMSRDFVVADIENRPDGSMLAVDTYDGSEHTAHYDWEEWLRWVKAKAVEDSRYRIVYAHNGGKWDWLSFLQWMIAEGTDKWDAIETNDRIVAISLPMRSRHRMQLRDSLYLLNCSLDEAGRKYVGRGKVEYDKFPPGLSLGVRPHWLWLNDRAAFWRYLHGDTELLYESLCQFANLVFTRIAPVDKLRLTLPALAMQIFRTSYLAEPISTPGDERARLLLRAGYVGGRVECFKPGYYSDVNVYDFNSLYPSVMATTPVPTTGRVRWTRQLKLDECGVYQVRFNQTDRSRLPLLMLGGVGVYEGEGVYFTNELRRFVTVGTLEVIRGFTFNESGLVFRDYVEKLYALRLTDRDGPLGNTCKLLLNSLYGKFGQKPERTRIRMLTAEEIGALVAKRIHVQPISRDNPLLCRVPEVKRAPFEHVGIAGVITSEARARLWEAFDAGVVYCDTDSIHTTGKLAADPDTLGALKHEFSGEAIYIGKKLYGLRKDNKPKIRAKGIRVRKRLKSGEYDPDDENGFELTFEGLRSLVDSGNVCACEFRSATTANAVLKGADSACIFRKRVRTVRRTAK